MPSAPILARVLWDPFDAGIPLMRPPGTCFTPDVRRVAHLRSSGTVMDVMDSNLALFSTGDAPSDCATLERWVSDRFGSPSLAFVADDADVPLRLWWFTDVPGPGLATVVSFGLSSAQRGSGFGWVPELVVTAPAEHMSWAEHLLGCLEAGRAFRDIAGSRLWWCPGQVIRTPHEMVVASTMSSWLITSHSPILAEGFVPLRSGDPIRLLGAAPLRDDEAAALVASSDADRLRAADALAGIVDFSRPSLLT